MRLTSKRRLGRANPVMVNASLHIHLDAHNCLEVIVVRGAASKVHEVAGQLIATKGVQNGRLITTNVFSRTNAAYQVRFGGPYTNIPNAVAYNSVAFRSEGDLHQAACYFVSNALPAFPRPAPLPSC